MRTISICVTTHNRVMMTIKSFLNVLDDERVSEVVIVDDNSDEGQYRGLKSKLDELKSDKIKLFRNEKNLGCYRNKRESVLKATNENVIIADSDNIFSKDYIDKLYEYGYWGETVAYAPDFAKPNFDYRAYDGIIISKQNVHTLIGKPGIDALLNTMNYFVNREQYLKVWKDEGEPHAIDSVFHNYNWLAAGNLILVTKGLEYIHTVHDGSLYKQVGGKTHRLAKEINSKLKMLR
jgi:glycosyltransferase involved in cell wall biosynthesis